MKKFFAVLLTMVLAIGFMGETQVSAATLQEYTQANQICEICYQGYNGGTQGPIIVIRGFLKKGNSSKEVYLVTLSGTELVENQSTGYLTDLLVGFNQNNAYLRNVVSVIKTNIPAGSNLILSGHSLGGMVAQQVAANSEIKAKYNVLNTVTFGSPLISEGSREGTVKRLGDVSDVVPYLSATGNIVWQVCGLNRENGGYGTDVGSAHSDSYIRSDVWGKYDVTGTKYGSAKLSLDLASQRYYKSPTK